MESLDDLTMRLQALPTQLLSVPDDLLAEFELPALPGWLLGQGGDALRFENATLSRVAESLSVNGVVRTIGLGTLEVELDVEATNDGLRSQILLGLPEDTTLARLIEPSGIALPEAVLRLIDGAMAAAARVQRVADAGWVMSLALAGEVSIPIASTQLVTTAKSLDLSLLPLKPLALNGGLTLGDLSAPWSFSFEEGRIATSFANLSLVRLARALGLSFVPPVDLPVLDGMTERLTILLEEGDIRLLSGVESAAGFASLLVARVSGDWVMAATLDLKPDLGFSQLSQALAPLDQGVKSLLDFGAPTVTYATLAARNLSLPAPGGVFRTVDLPEGLDIRGALRLQQFGLELIGNLVGVRQLDFHVPVEPDFANLTIVAEIPGTVEFVPGVLITRDFGIAIQPDPLAISASGTTTFNLPGVQIPPLELGAILLPEGVSVYLRTDAPWRSPFGLPFDVEDLAIEVIQRDLVEFAFSAKIALRGGTFQFAATLENGQVPTSLIASYSDSLSFTTLVEDLAGVSFVPAVMQPLIEQPKIYIVVNPAGEIIVGKRYDPGLVLEGTATFLGLAVKLGMSVSRTGLSAEGALVGIPRQAGVFEITGTGGRPTAFVRIDTRSNPIMTMEGRVKLLEIEQEVTASVETDGARFSLRQSIGRLDTEFDVLLGHGVLTAAGRVDFRLDIEVGPIRLGKPGPSLGMLKLDTRLSAATTIELSEQDSYRVTARCSFEFAGVAVTLPSLDISGRGLDRVAEDILTYVRDHAQELFAEIFRDAERWIKAIADGLVRNVDDVATALRDQFGKTPEEIANYLRDRLDYTLDVTAECLARIQEGAIRIATIFANRGEEPEQIAAAIWHIEKNGPVLGEALKAASIPPQIARRVLDQVGAGGDVIDAVIGVLDPASVAAKLAEKALEEAAAAQRKLDEEAAATARKVAEEVAKAADDARRKAEEAANKLLHPF